MVKYGLLKAKPANGYSVWAKDCIIFPLKNQDNKIVSLYGRSITNNKESRHFYLQNREGLYPGYPSLQTKKLILTESIIDAASLLQQKEIKEQYSVLSLYGTNGLTDEHIKTISELPQLEEIILSLSGDLLQTVSKTDSLISYHLLCKNLSIKYDGSPVDLLLQSKSNILKTTRLPLDVLFLKRNKSVFLFIMAGNGEKVSISPEYLNKIVTK